MKLVTPQLEVISGEGFKHDVLQRKSYGEALLNLITRSEDELVISLNGQWGEGKSTFVKMWADWLSEQEIHCVYIDLFSTDYLNDPFITVAGAITEYFSGNIEKAEQEKLTELLQKTKSVGVNLASWSAKVGIKALTLGVIRENEIEELKDVKSDISTTAGSVFGEFIEERLQSHSTDKETLKTFQGLLSEMPAKLKGKKDTPFIIIVDELDRCRPNYSVEVIEQIKHLFSVKNIVFVLVLNRDQLEQSVKKVYGSSIDAKTYLQKFINIETELPKRTAERRSNDIGDYIKRLAGLHDIEMWGDDEYVYQFLEYMSKHLNLSLREIERVFTNISVFYAVSKKDHFRLSPLVVFLACIKVVEPDVYSQLHKKEISYSDTVSAIKLLDYSDKPKDEQHTFDWFLSWLKFSLVTNEDYGKSENKALLDDMRKSLVGFRLPREDIVPLHTKRMSLFSVR